MDPDHSSVWVPQLDTMGLPGSPLSVDFWEQTESSCGGKARGVVFPDAGMGRI